MPLQESPWAYVRTIPLSKCEIVLIRVCVYGNEQTKAPAGEAVDKEALHEERMQVCLHTCMLCCSCSTAAVKIFFQGAANLLII